jgi:hypothetical protein
MTITLRAARVYSKQMKVGVAAALVLWVAACGKITPAGTDAGGPGAGAGGAAAQGGAGGSAAGAGGSSTGGGGASGDGGATGSGGGAGSSGFGGAAGADGGAADGGSVTSFFDDFEDGNIDPWALGPTTTATYTIAPMGANGTSHSFEISGAVDYYRGPNVTFANSIMAHRVSFWVLVGAFQGVSPSATFAASADDAALQQVLRIELSSVGLQINNGAPIMNLPIALDRWYHFELTIDWTARTVQTSMDGVAVPGSFSLLGTNSAGVKRLDLFNLGSGFNPPVVYFDEIEVSE